MIETKTLSMLNKQQCKKVNLFTRMDTEFKENHSTHLNPLSFKSLTHYVTVLTSDPRFTIAKPQLDTVSSHGLQRHSCLYKASDKQMGTPLLHILSSPILLLMGRGCFFIKKSIHASRSEIEREKNHSSKSYKFFKVHDPHLPPHIHSYGCKLKHIPA